MVLPEPNHKPRIVKVERTIRETPTIKTIRFKDNPSSKAIPGQFDMVWIPGLDEVPMSISYTSTEGLAAITVRSVGPATEALHSIVEGQIFGVRGPYGRGFTVTDNGEALLVAGGSGGAALAPLSDLLSKMGVKHTVIVGAQTSSELLFLDRYERNVSAVGGRVVPVTEDGSYGIKGLASEVAQDMLRKHVYKMIYSCGPEAMIKSLLLLSLRYSIPFQASLERIMKCGIGICGSCVIDSLRVCREGPVFDGETLRRLDEFGKSRRNHSGRKVPL
ncbi:dihydroorotate dehydrogenase electron transfer subunit [Candidatus Bathyarchaeota archaeon]|nr:dihydroorotate dehydrogenase electron transfer subunit [Candidatus Bathyarchaeota archaeon]